MNDNRSVPPGSSNLQDRDLPTTPSGWFAYFYTQYQLQLDRFCRRRLPLEVAEDVLIDFWCKVWETLEKPGGFEYRNEAKARGWLYRILRRTIVNYYRDQEVIRDLIIESLDDESAVEGVEALLQKLKFDPTDSLQRELVEAIGEQALGNKEHLELLQRRLAGKGNELPAEWTDDWVYDAWYRIKTKILKAFGKT